MSNVQSAAQFALTARLRELLPRQITDRFIDGTHTQRFEDNLLPSFSTEVIRTLRRQIERGAGGELRPTPSGKRSAHAPYSSAALAANAFGAWIGNEDRFFIAGLDGFDAPLSLEYKLKIAHGGGEANLDCAVASTGRLVGIESKLTECLAPHQPVAWRPPYRTPQMAELLNDGWREIFDASLDGSWLPQHLGVEQLIKHALALNSHANGRQVHLVYVYWEPAQPRKYPEVVKHRNEVAEFASRVAGGTPAFHALSYDELFVEWTDLAPSTPWLATHLSQLRERYSAAHL